MRKFLCGIALLIAVLSSLSAHTERVFSPQAGFQSPSLILEGNNALSDAMEKGCYSLVDFWSTTDPESRLRVMDIANALSNLHERPVCHIAVNMDGSKKLYDEVTKRDNNKGCVNYHVGADVDDIVHRWHLNSGLRSFLINPSGKIIAVNPSIETLRNLCGN